MVSTLQIVGLVTMLVLTVSGLITIIAGIYYFKLFGPVMKPMVKYYKYMMDEVAKEIEEEAE